MTTERLHDLLALWDDDEMSASETSEFAALLEGDAAARAGIVEHFRLTANLVEHFRSANADRQFASAVDELHEQHREQSAVRSAPSHKQPRPRRWRWRPLRYHYPAAAALVFLVAVPLVGYLSGWFSPAGADPAPIADVRPDVHPAPVVPEENLPVVAATFGSVQVLTGADWQEAQPRQPIRPGQTLRVGPLGSARVALWDGTLFDLGAGTEIRVAGDRDVQHWELAKGNLYVDAAPQPAGAPLILNRGRYDQVRVLGTRFQLQRDARRQSRVLVEHGLVEFGEQNHTTPVKQNQQSVAPFEQPPQPPSQFDPAALWRGLNQGLVATYYRDDEFAEPAARYLDPTIDVDSARASANPRLLSSGSVRWTGEIQPAHTGMYTFSLYTFSDQTAALWINGRKLIDESALDGPRREGVQFGTIRLEAGKKYPLKLDYRKKSGAALVRLLWSSHATPLGIVSNRQLFPTAGE